MRASTTTRVKTSGVTSASQRFTRWVGVLPTENPSYLQKVSLGADGASALSRTLRVIVAVVCFSGIQHKYSNWIVFLVKRLTGAKTLPTDFNTKVSGVERFVESRLLDHMCRGPNPKETPASWIVRLWKKCSIYLRFISRHIGVPSALPLHF